MRTNALSPRKVKLLAALVVLGLAGVSAALATAADRTASAGPAAMPSFTPDPIPAEILGSNVPVPIPASVIAEKNGWLVSNGYNLVAVYAGSKGDDPSQGRVVIVRQDLRAGKQTVQIIDAGATGPLTVAAGAPAGAAVETSALTGTLVLNTSAGPTVTLNLSTNTISVT